MKTIFLSMLAIFCGIMANAQINIQMKPINIQSAATIEKIKIPFTQPPLVHNDGGWEKGPSNWTASNQFPLSYRGGLLFLDRGANGLIRYLMIEIKFKEAGSIEVTANSMTVTAPGFNGWKTVFGKTGQTVKQTIMTREGDFGKEINLYLKNFKPYKKSQVN